MKIDLATNIGIADSELLSFMHDKDKLVVTIELWDARKLLVTFAGFEGLKYLGLGDVSAIVEETEPTPFLNEILSIMYDKLPETHNHHIYQFLDLDDEVGMEVIARKVTFTTL